MTRRELLLTTVAAPLAAAAQARPPLCLFSKHLPELGYEDLGRAVREMDFDGVDLTVRPGGHVLPERASEDLPRAVEAIRNHNLSVPMITTGLLSDRDPASRPTLSTAGRLKIPCFKLGYYRYRTSDIDKTIADVRRDTRSLVELGREHGVVAGFHNHSGDYVGAAVWDIRAIIAGMDPRWIGYYYDPCHATIEGGAAGWWVSFGIAAAQLKMVALKDFYWEKAGGKWKPKMCPMGEGMVDWSKFFSLLAKARFTGPISLHLEYQAADERKAMVRDLEFVKKEIAAAYRA